MSRGSKKQIGAGSRGKGSGTGAMTMTPKDKLKENQILSNRDKAQHTRERGLDSKQVATEQRQDQSANRLRD
ncbi:hypothetical protein X743_16930 [Mesorhizobium sp. LNHC252B00]|nr:hypothetical protein X743_16930 [Mesorhizobium sp. LNHC252B00]